MGRPVPSKYELTLLVSSFFSTCTRPHCLSGLASTVLVVTTMTRRKRIMLSVMNDKNERLCPDWTYAASEFWLWSSDGSALCSGAAPRFLCFFWVADIPEL